MAEEYLWGYNLFKDYLVESILNGKNISNKKYISEQYNMFTYFVSNFSQNENDVQYLDFEIRKNRNGYKVYGKNSLSALWLSGIFPNDARLILKNSSFVLDDINYVYNEKTCELKILEKK